MGKGKSKQLQKIFSHEEQQIKISLFHCLQRIKEKVHNADIFISPDQHDLPCFSLLVQHCNDILLKRVYLQKGLIKRLSEKLDSCYCCAPVQ